MPATYDDANLVVQLVRWGTEMGLDEAHVTLFADGFDAQTASTEDDAVRTMLMFFETVSTLVKQDILDRGLVLDLWWASGVWSRVGPAALRDREKLGEPRLWENFEELTKSA